jgi:hypothetical protein
VSVIFLFHIAFHIFFKKIKRQMTNKTRLNVRSLLLVRPDALLYFFLFWFFFTLQKIFNRFTYSLILT